MTSCEAQVRLRRDSGWSGLPNDIDSRLPGHADAWNIEQIGNATCAEATGTWRPRAGRKGPRTRSWRHRVDRQDARRRGPDADAHLVASVSADLLSRTLVRWLIALQHLGRARAPGVAATAPQGSTR